MPLLLTLLFIFAPLSLVTVGSGGSALAEIHRQVVEVHHWLTPAQFVDIFAISRMSPGPGSVYVTLIGWQIAGFWGAVVSTVAIFGPTAFLIYFIARIWARYRGAKWQIAMERGLRPVAAGLILSATYVLLQSVEGGWLSRAIAFGSTGLLLRTRINPLILIGGGAAIFMLFRAVLFV